MSDKKVRAKVSAKTVTYSTPFMDILHSRADFGDFAKDYYVVTFGERGGVVGVKDGKILMVRQYRFLIDGYSWELPGGTIEIGESAEAGLARECFEETGLRPKDLELLLVYYPGLDNVDNRTSIYVSRRMESVKPFVGNPAEVSQIGWFTLDQCLSMVLKQEILDAMTISGLLAYHCFRGTRPVL
jgi:8-oxo-dGTP pyrophosphatase MutT (NUDIX family)